MFKTLISVGLVSVNGIRWWRFNLEDTCFKETILSKSGYLDSCDIVLQLIQIYKKRKLNVLPNLVAYYLLLNKEGYSIVSLITEDHPYFIDKTDKSIMYYKLYRPLLKIRLPAFFPAFKKKYRDESQLH